MYDELGAARRLDHIVRLHGIAFDPLNGIGERACSRRCGRIAMQGPHLPAAPQERLGNLSADTSGDADDQSCSSRSLHVFSPVSR